MSTFGRISIFDSLRPGWKTSLRAPSFSKAAKVGKGVNPSLPKIDYDHTIDTNHILNLMSATHKHVVNETGPIEFGNFLLTQRLGQGGYGITFKALDMRDGRERVVKVPLRFDDFNFKALVEEGQKALVSGSLDGQVVTVKELGDVNGVPYISMRLIDGNNLYEILALNGGFLPQKRSLEIMIDLCDSVEHYHALGIIHRDIKPENVMIGHDGKVVLIDPGLCAVESEATGFAGTPLYFSPEQARGEQLTPRSEVFTLGVILLELLTGEHPFRSFDHSALIDAIQNNEPDYSLLPQRTKEQKQVLHVIRRALVKNPNKRPSSVAELRRQLEIISRKLP